MSERLRAAIVGMLLLATVFAGVWFFVLGVDWAQRNLEGGSGGPVLHRVLHAAASAWFAVLAPLLLLRPASPVALLARAGAGGVLAHAGLVAGFAPVTALGVGVFLHAVVWSAAAARVARTPEARPRRETRHRDHVRVRFAAAVLALATLEGIVLLESLSDPAPGPVLAALALGAGTAIAVAWRPRERRTPLLRSWRSVFRRRGAARLLALRAAVPALVVAGALAIVRVVLTDRGATAPFDSRFWAWAALPTAVGLLVGAILLRRWVPLRRRRRRPAQRRLVATGSTVASAASVSPARGPGTAGEP